MAKTPRFQYNKSTEIAYRNQIRKIARHVGDIVDAHTNSEGIIPTDENLKLERSAELYAEAIEPWASKVSWQMITAISAKNRRDWESLSSIIGQGVDSIARSDPISGILRDMQREQVSLIKSIPTDAAERANELSMETFLGVRRAEDAAKMIADTTGVSIGRANLIARTGASTTNHDVSMARATSIGVQKYTWETMQDEAVRPSHQELQGMIFDIDNPPEIEGEGAHGPGDIWNCRCFPSYILDKFI